GIMIVNGITTASALSYNFGDITINNGGKLTFPFVSGAWSSNKFVTNVITIKNGGSLENSTTSNYWSAASSLVLENGGTYKSISTTTNFPATITLNEGTVWYAKSTAGDQTVKTMTYKNLKISDTGCNKLISSAISVNGTLFLTSGTLASGINLTMGNGATIEREGGIVTGTLTFSGNTRVKYTGTGSITTGSELPALVRFLQVYIGTGNTLSLNTSVTVADTLTLSSGILDNSTNQISLTNQVLIRRASGSFSASPNSLGSINIDYISNSTTVTTGFEVPSSTTALMNLSVTGNKGVNLSSDITANGNVVISGSNLNTGVNKLILGNSASLIESNGKMVYGNLQSERNLIKNVNEIFGGIGLEIKAKGVDPGITQVIRENTAAINGTLRTYKINPATNNNLDADIKFVYNESELNGVDESGLGVYNTTDNGTSWIRVGSKVNEAGNYIISEKINNFGWLSANTEGLAIPVLKDADDINDNSFRANWEPVAGATGYRIDVSLNPAFSSYVINYNDADAGNGTA
ncbi:MAG: hypothetical protein JNM51_08550, partial [Bacteroidia bacterium]|nr:hypothetical protein [Bacteroidia bacterium]